MVITNVTGDTSVNKKKTKGKRKIDLKKIERYNSRLVTFSKRRTGLFKKAAETCVLTGAQIAILVNSPGGRSSYAFRHPNSDVMVDRYLNNNNKDTTGADTGTTQKSPPPLPMNEFNQHYGEVSKELEAEKKRGVVIPVNNGGLRWYDQSVDGMDVEELQRYLCSLEELKKKVMTRADELMMINKSVAFFGSNNNFQSMDVPTNGGSNSFIPSSFDFN